MAFCNGGQIEVSFSRTWVACALSIALTSTAFADVCPEPAVVSGSLKATCLLGADESALVTVGEVSQSLEFRQYRFSSRGMFQVFESTYGPEKTSTGARTYFLFPRKKPLTFGVEETGELAVSVASGQTVRFSAMSRRIHSFSDVQILEDPQISMKNYGGVELRSFTNLLLLDTGWRVYEPTYWDANLRSLLRDSRGSWCILKNSEIFDYSAEPMIKFKTDADFAAFLKQRCPTVDVSPLL